MKNKLQRLSVFFFLVLCPLTALAQTWEFAGWYGGGCYPNIEFDPQVKGRIYLTSDVAGIWRSNDYGDHWYFVTKGLGNLLVTQLAVAPTDSNILYAAAGVSVYISKDAGNTWAKTSGAGAQAKFSRPISYRPIAVDPTNAARLCIGSNAGQVFCSVDYGATWIDLDPLKSVFPAAMAIRALALDKTGTNLYAATGKGVVRCQIDKNICWPLTTGPVKASDVALTNEDNYKIYAAGDTKLWYSVDQGGTWKQTAAVAKGTTDRIAIDPATPSTIRVVWINNWEGGVLLSKDSGATWTSQDKNLTADIVNDPTRAWSASGGRTTSIKVDPSNPNVLFRTDWWGVFRSDNGGLNWYEKIVGAPNTVVTQVTVAPNNTLYVSSMDNGLLRSIDGGKLYKALFPVSGYNIDRNGHVWRVALSGTNIVATSSPWDKKINQVIVSKDNGQTFTLVRSGLPATRPVKNTMWSEGYPRGLAVDPNNPNTIYLGIDGDDGGGLYVSKDGGMTWQLSKGQPASKRINYGLAVDPTNSKRILWGANGTGGGAYVSSDGGLTFQNNLKAMQWIFDVAIGPDGSMYAAGDVAGSAKLYVSRNSGSTWALLKDFGAGRALSSVAVDPSNPQRVAVSTASWTNGAPCRIFLSQDRGASWSDVTGVLPDGPGAASLAFDPVNQYLYAGRYAGSVYKLRLGSAITPSPTPTPTVTPKPSPSPSPSPKPRGKPTR